MLETRERWCLRLRPGRRKAGQVLPSGGSIPENSAVMFVARCYFALSSAKTATTGPARSAPSVILFRSCPSAVEDSEPSRADQVDSKYADDEDKVADCKRFCTLAHGVEPSSIIRTTRWKDLRDETQAGKLGALHGLLDRFDRGITGRPRC